MGNKTSSSNLNYPKSQQKPLINNIPESLLLEISHYLVPPTIFLSEKNLLQLGSQLLKLHLSLKIPTNLSQTKQQFILLSKYSKYNTDYEWYYTYQAKRDNRGELESHPILLDILFTGCNLPCAYSTYDYFSPQMEEDLKTCIHLFPNCVNSKFGSLRCRHNVTPLHAACTNTNIPLSIIKYLIKHGANMDQPICVNGQPIHILEDLDDNHSYRLESIKEIFDTYKQKKIT